jgi:hypothetical protein
MEDFWSWPVVCGVATLDAELLQQTPETFFDSPGRCGSRLQISPEPISRTCNLF